MEWFSLLEAKRLINQQKAWYDVMIIYVTIKCKLYYAQRGIKWNYNHREKYENITLYKWTISIFSGTVLQIKL